MRRVALRLVCGLFVLFGCAGCEDLIEALARGAPSDWQGEPDAGSPATEPSFEGATTFALIGDGRVLRATPQQGLQIVDVRAPQRPRVEGAYPIEADALEFFRAGDVVVAIAGSVPDYRGDRAYLPVRCSGVCALLSLDISQRDAPRLLQRIELEHRVTHSRLRRAADGTTLLIASNVDERSSRLERFVLRDGMLEQTDRLELDTAVQALAGSPDTMVLASARTPSLVSFVDLRREPLTVHARSLLHGHVRADTDFHIGTDHVRVVFLSDAGRTKVASFDPRTGFKPNSLVDCELREPPPDRDSSFRFHAAAFDTDGHGIYASVGQGAQLYHFTFRGDGSCPDPVRIADAGGVGTLQMLSSDHLIGTTASAVTLYNSESLLSQVTLPQPPVRFGRLTTTGPGFLALPYTARDTTTGTLGSRVELLTLSDDNTLTVQASLPGATAAIVSGRSALMTVTPTQLRTLDAREPDAPRPLGLIALGASYNGAFAFGDVIARIAPDALEILPRTADFARAAPRSVLAIPAAGEWIKVEQLLVNVRLTESGTRIEVFDLRDPLQPRAAGLLESAEIVADRSAGYHELKHHTLGAALVFTHLVALADGSLQRVFDVVDLRDPDAPALVRAAYALPAGDTPAELFATGTTLYANESGNHSYRIDFSDPVHPTRSDRVSVPGPILASHDDVLYAVTREPAVHAMRWQAPEAVAQRFGPPGPWLSAILTDSAGRILTEMSSTLTDDEERSAPQGAWTHLAIVQPDVGLQAELPIDKRATCREAANGRILCRAPGALLVFDGVRLVSALPELAGPWVFDGTELFAADAHGAHYFRLD